MYGGEERRGSKKPKKGLPGFCEKLMKKSKLKLNEP